MEVKCRYVREEGLPQSATPVGKVKGWIDDLLGEEELERLQYDQREKW